MWSNPKVRGIASPSLAAHGCAIIGSKLYMFGGLTPAGAASDELYSLETGNDLTALLSKFVIHDVNVICGVTLLTKT